MSLFAIWAHRALRFKISPLSSLGTEPMAHFSYPMSFDWPIVKIFGCSLLRHEKVVLHYFSNKRGSYAAMPKRGLQSSSIFSQGPPIVLFSNEQGKKEENTVRSSIETYLLHRSP